MACKRMLDEHMLDIVVMVIAGCLYWLQLCWLQLLLVLV